ncbi:MAG: DUF87 domain-containing protein [Ktedonobacteraceae bacterium]
MSDKQTQLLADGIFARVEGTTAGHCVRVDFLERGDALDICRYMAMQPPARVADLLVRVLVSSQQEKDISNLFITTDEAVEIRNRKQVRLCLFVPSDLVDAAYSSLANSFALIDGQTLFEAALKKELKVVSPEAQEVLRSVARGPVKASYEQRLDFAVTAQTMGKNTRKLGLELWRVGLIADARPDFSTCLTSNGACTLLLSHPTRPGATPRERIQSLKVDKATATALGRFFRGRSMNDVRSWSRELDTAGALTFDRWIFPDTDRSDIRSVTVQPFINTHGIVERFCKLTQPDKANGSLQAICGPKGTMVVKWSCESAQPQNLSGWSVRILPSDYDPEATEESDFSEPKIPRVPAKQRSYTIKLDMEDDEIPHGPVCVRVAPLDATGNEITNPETGEIIAGTSTEFFLVSNVQTEMITEARQNRRIVPTLSYGYLEAAMELPEGRSLDEVQAQWIAKDLFSLTFSNRLILNMSLSETLVELERKVRDNPRNGGCFTLAVDEVLPVAVDAITPYELQYGGNANWTAFWRAREAFFSRLKKQPARDTVETADWTPDLANAAIRYTQSYQDLLDGLIKNRGEQGEMLEALSIDSLLVQISGRGQTREEALVILPTHPLRLAWIASYTQLLRSWEEQLLTLPKRERKRSMDMQAVRLLTPTNVPAFAYHAASSQAFLFFQNIRLYHGVALPATIADPRLRFNNVAYILGGGREQSSIGDIQPDHLKEHLERFSDSHAYAQTLVTTLVNPDRGDFFAEAVRMFLDGKVRTDEEVRPMLSFQITAFLPAEHTHSLTGFEQKLQRSGQRHERMTDYFLPGVSTTVRSISKLAEKAPEAHLAVVTDLTKPAIVIGPQSSNNPESRAEISSFSLYGLITRFIPQFTVDERGLLWYYRIIPEGIKRPEAHPVSARYSEVLLELHQSLLDAQGYLARKQNNVCPMLEVRIEKERSALLEHLHKNTNWVITLDRFFALDYYDSPYTPELRALAQKYVLDYSPESIEGFGHRMLVTTTWHEEIETLLAQAMAELGFNSVDQSVGQLLHYLKTVSGRLALQALDSQTNAAAAVGLGVVTAWLQKNGRLRDAVLVPVDIYPRIFSPDGSGKPQAGERRCDLVLVSLRRNIVDATFIEVKWRRGLAPLQELATDMALQMEGSAQAMRNRFFQEKRVDSVLQRSYLANVLKFYFERSRRYELIGREAEKTFLEQLARLEKTGLDFRPAYEGYIVNLEGQQRKPLFIETQTERARITVLTARDFYNADPIEFSSLLNPAASPANTVPLEQVASPVEPNEDDTTPIAGSAPDYRAVEETLPGQQAPVEKTSPAQPAEEMRDDVHVPLGEAAGEPVAWQPSTKGSPHLFIIGIPGQGKSWTITRILHELSRQHVPTLVLDFHGQFADPDGQLMRTMHPVVVDAAKGLPFPRLNVPPTAAQAVGWPIASHWQKSSPLSQAWE